MDLDIDLGSLLRPTARAVSDSAEPAQRVIYPMVPSWQREDDAVPPSGDVAEPSAPAMALPPSSPLRTAEAWVPTHSARLGSWPGSAASNDVSEADDRPAPVMSAGASPAASPIGARLVPEGPSQRRNQVRTIVGAHGQRWLQALSVGLRPVVTARCHPHVVDRLAAAWPEPQAAAACLDDLLFNRRPGRRGFSLAVLGELCELQRALAERRRR